MILDRCCRSLAGRAFRLHGTLPQFLRASGFSLGQLLDQFAKKLRISAPLIE
ncbi:hypothetical protein [Rhizobium rhizogenes]|uniref:hypothetical protein n=1 Tax=Rhizobium rhizogenes TaxID=359 RepID=UPI0015724771|nr:hypothetical protein [Rhizobium rhizogenes]NTF91696.1 hypothetical protein [Rhizobium rhizogenes]NTG25531.1 hypothetical protein [Rhizobium rhizogenes]NTH23462.1 hypothetical protein [Rhizobium rhizogenes]